MASADISPNNISSEQSEWLHASGEIYRRIEDTHGFVRAVFSGRRRNYSPDFDRVDIRPVHIKSETLLHVEFRRKEEVTTKNYSVVDFEKLALLNTGYANFLVESRDESFEVRLGKRGQVFQKKTKAKKALEPAYEHDRKKARHLAESDPYLIAVGISDSEGKLKPSMRDKYLQVEEFLKILEISTEIFAERSAPIRIVDLGCGHAYLTFAAYRFFQLKSQDVSFVGVDVREKTRIRNESIATELGITGGITFVDKAISEYPAHDADVVIALHACDTATDDALAWAVKSNAQVILAAPCCHHYLHSRVKERPAALTQIFDHGILSVRQIDLLTDALRAAILNLVGFRAEIFEFVSGDHTARNLMIRATRRAGGMNPTNKDDKKVREYRHTCAIWGIKPALEERLELGGIRLSD